MNTPVKDEFQRRGIQVLPWAMGRQFTKSTVYLVINHGWAGIHEVGSVSYRVATQMAAEVGMSLEEAFGPRPEGHVSQQSAA